MGSTSYDEARDASDPRWAGASWYGPTTGEYWIVNPREYADPRKHGPGYSGRLRTEPGSDPSIDAADADAAAAPPPAPPIEPTGETPVAPSSRPTMDAPPPRGASTAPAGEPFLDALVRQGSSDPWHRLGLVLLAWAPIGVASATVIGQATGCASFSAGCDGTDPYLPWVAQAVIVGLLLVAAPLSRIFAAGTVGLVIALVPATAFVIALGGAGSSAAAPVLAVVLAVGWLVGAGWGVRARLAPRAQP